jgi:hypothetical protein
MERLGESIGAVGRFAGPLPSAGRLAQGDGRPGDGGQLHGQLTAVNASGFVWRKGDPVLVLERVGRVNVVIVQGVRCQNRNVNQPTRVDGERGRCISVRFTTKIAV